MKLAAVFSARLSLIGVVVTIAGCAPTAIGSAPSTTAAPSSGRDACSAIGPILRREVMLVGEHSSRMHASTGASLAGSVGALHGIERAFEGVVGDLRSAHFDLPENARDATLAMTELGDANRELVVSRRNIESLVRKTSAPLREAREKAWEMKTICEGVPARTSDCRLVSKAFSDDALAGWSTSEGVEQAMKSVARLSVKDAAIARDIGAIKSKLAAASAGMTELGALNLDDAAKRLGAHADVATKAMVRIRERCGTASALSSVDWIAAPPGTDPRKLTVLVLGLLPDSMKKAFDAEEKSEDLSSGTTGSGVIVVRNVGGRRRVLVVTNRHVVAHALRTKIVVDGSTALHDARVAYLDPHHDVAVLEMIAGEGGVLPFEAGVTLETQSPADQQAVVAAGYPGMGRRPSYQVTKGYISNRLVHLEGDIAPYIQHTAPIDPGSSGGPLLSDRGRLLGINTLKLHGRDGVALAVPGDVVADAVRAAESAPIATNVAEDARLSCLATIADLSTERPSEMATRHLSAGFVAETGPATWSRFTKTLTPEEQEEAAEDFRRDSLGILYMASVMRLSQSLRASGGVSSLEMCENVTLTTSSAAPSKGDDATLARFVIQTVKGPRELKLMRERGSWTIASFDFRDAATSPNRGGKPGPARKP